MEMKKIINLEAFLSMAGSIGLFVWWFAMPLFLPLADAEDKFRNLVLDPQWTPVNLIGLVAVIFLALGYILFGISALRRSSYPRIPLWFHITGAPVFGLGVLFPLRTMGLPVFCTGTFWLAIKITKD